MSIIIGALYHVFIVYITIILSLYFMRNLLLLILLLTGQVAVSQGATVTVFENEDAESIEILEETVIKNAIKWNWSLLARGVFMLNYERELKSWISVEGGFGLCYRDFLNSGYEETFGDYSSENEGTVNLIKPAFEARVRFYPFELQDMEGFYCSVGYRNRRYGANVDIEEVHYETSAKYNETQFLVGWQYESYWMNNILTDFYVGVGFKNYEENSYEYSNGDHYKPTLDKGNVPTVFLGMKLAVPFN